MISLACSATPYVEDIKWVDKAIGMTLASATRTFERPYTSRLASTTPPCFSGSIAHDEDGWNSVPADLRSHSIQSSSLCTLEPGVVSFVRTLLIGLVSPSWRASLIPARRISASVLLLVLRSLGWMLVAGSTHQLGCSGSSGR